ncbi:MAG: ester cyclase [Burkholderiales bacterium]
MSAKDIVLKYLDEWDKRNPNGIMATFAEGGTYCDPITGKDLSGDAIMGYAQTLFTAFPDVRFETGLVAESGNVCAFQWVMKGTNTGKFGDVPASGKQICLHGVDFIVVENGKIRSVQGQFDQLALHKQMGLA